MTDRHALNQEVVDEFRDNGGLVGGQFEGLPLLLLTTTGAHSGQRGTRPVMYLEDGDRYVVFALNGGRPASPGWLHNLLAGGDAVIEVGTRTERITARLATGAERDRLWARQLAVYPPLADFQAATDRVIPVVVLERAPG